jgi:hypothetical protein
MGAKIAKITKLFFNVEHLKNQGVTYWAERSGPPVVQIIDRLQKPVF